MKESSDGAISLSLRLIKANELARQGRIKDAKNLLSPNGLPPDDPLALETLAALVTRDGDYVRALSLWKLLLKQDPKNPETQAMIAAIETWMARPSWYGLILPAAAAALLLIVALVAWRASSHPASPMPITSSPMIAAPANVASPTAIKPTSPPRSAATAATKTDAPAIKFQLAPTPRPKK